MAAAEVTSRDTTVSIREKVGFLRRPDIYPRRPARVEVKETHMSWLFLTEHFVYKLKKPVRYDFLDFSTLEARRQDCEREVQLNRRLAGDVYLGSVPLCLQVGSRLTLGGSGTVVDWLVVMRRLPAARMLDAAIETHSVSDRDVARVGRLLLHFYRHVADPAALTPASYRYRFEQDLGAHGTELLKPTFGLPAVHVERLIAAQRNFLVSRRELLEQRARDGRIVEAHGDLRPEHICLLRPPVIIDCLEFRRDLRLLDPLDELAYLALECERLGAADIGERLLGRYMEAGGDMADAALIGFYKVFRACLRAKIALWHTEDHEVRDHDQWRARARHYLELASRHAAALA